MTEDECFFHHFQVPTELFREVRPYLINYDYWKFTSSTKSYNFSTIKRETIHFYLQIEDLKFFWTEYPQILSKISSPFHQFSLTLHPSPSRSKEFLSMIKELSCHTLNIHYSGSLFEKEGEKWFSFIQKNKQQVTLFSSTKLLSISESDDFLGERITLHGSRNIQNFRPFQNVKRLSLFNCSILTDVSYLGNVRHLEIGECHSLTNLRGLGNVRILSLWNCSGITDISPLTNNYSLSIRVCPVKVGIRESFANVKILETDLLESSDDFRILRSIQSLNINLISDPLFYIPHVLKVLTIWKGDFHIIDSNFLILTKVIMKNCKFLEALVPSFNKIPVVYLENCPSLHDISSLGNNKKVILDNCQSIQNFQSLQHVPNVEIRSCLKFMDPHQVKNVLYLKLISLPQITDVSMLGEIRSLELCNCSGIVSLKGLENVETLFLFDLSSVENIPESLNCEKIVLRGSWDSQPLLSKYKVEPMLLGIKMKVFLKKNSV